MQAELSEVNSKITDTKETVVVIENDHGKSLGVLFDGYSLLHGICSEIRTDVTKLLSDQMHQDFKIKWIDARLQKTS
jgi:hypothetical protein